MGVLARLAVAAQAMGSGLAAGYLFSGSTSAGHAGTSGALAAVLPYRLINYWVVLPELSATCRSGALNRKPVRGRGTQERPRRGWIRVRSRASGPR
jgi:hypothetical protein